MKKTKLLLATVTGIALSTTAIANDRYIIFGDSLSDTGSALSSKVLSQNTENQPSSISIDINGNKLTRDLGNNYWALADTAFIDNLKPFQGAPITSFDTDNLDQAPKTWANYLSEENEKDLITYRAAASDSQSFGKYINNDMYNILFATATAQSGDNFVDDFPKDGQDGLYPYIDCPADKYGEVLQGLPSSSCVPSVTKQVKKFIELAKSSDFTPRADTKVIIWVGGNDVYGNIVKVLSIPKIDIKNIKSEFKRFHPSLLVSNVKTSIKLLKDFGVNPKNIYVFALPNFKYVPAVQELIQGFPSTAQSVISTLLNTMSNTYNYSLKSMTNKQGANFFDVGSIFIDLIKNPQNPEYKKFYGSINSDTLSMCTDTISTPSNNPQENFPICKGYIFYNDMHPTTYTHHLVADKFEEFANKYSSDQK